MKTLYIILGNGFSIDFISKMEKEKEIDVSNLFQFGNCVPWPGDNIPGFLSFKYCPNLWNLGARPCKSKSECISLIEEIITCANMFNDSIKDNPTRAKELDTKEEQSIYIKAYRELSYYLKHLFIYYDKKISDSELKDAIGSGLKGWGWIKFLDKINKDIQFSKVVIVTYNYDIWLERVLKILGISFNIASFTHNKNPKFLIIKPHGSISFIDKNADSRPFSIKYSGELSEGYLKDFKVGYSNLDSNYSKNAMIPPAGDSGRLAYTWAHTLRKHALTEASNLTEKDEVILCGVSYWHVDRKELDEQLTLFKPQINFNLVNPSPPKDLNAVLTTLFDNYVCYSRSEELGG